MDTYVSTVAYQSNLQPAGDILIQDEYFHSKIHDPFLLPLLQKNGYLTGIQKEELKNVALHCTYADEGEYPYGTVHDSNGVEHVVCRCTNILCPHITMCNPSADIETIQEIQRENKLEEPKIRRFYSGEYNFPDVAMSVEVPEIPLVSDNSAEEHAKDIQPEKKEHIPNTEQERTVEIVAPDPFVIQEKATLPVDKTQNGLTDNTAFERFKESTQQEIILSPVNARTVVNAGPGTGKTWTLIEKIIHTLNEDENSAQNILVLCFSKSAVDVIKKRLTSAAEAGRIAWTWHDVDIRTFDSFSTFTLSWVYENMPELLPRDFRLENLDYDARIQQATNIFSKQHDMLVDYEHIIVDEVQDLVGYRAQLVIEILKSLPSGCGFTLLGDSCQSLYDYVTVNNPNLISSEEFYHLLFKNFPNIDYCALCENHRQHDELGNMTVPYRNAILTGTADERRNIAAEVLSRVKTADFKFQHFQKEDALPYIQNGTLGILTRTNAQALQISSLLRTNEVPHLLQRGKGTQPLSSWICSVFSDYPNKTVNETGFIAQYLKKYPDTDYELAQKHWSALIDCQPGEPAAHYEVEDLLKGLLHNPRESLIYEAPDENDYAITVSTVHRAKGSEFDSVLVLDDVLAAKADTEQEELIEHKVCYVALTRPKKQIQSVHLQTQYIYTTKNETRRCFRAGGRPGKRYLSHFEVGQAKDILNLSTAEDEQRQKYIQNNLKSGCRLRLMKCSESEFEKTGYIRYKVVPEDNDFIVLAYTSPDFAREMEKAIQTIYNNTHCQIKYKYYPRHFSDVYVERLTTNIAVSDGQLNGATSYGDVQIWTGFTISGFAAMERDFY